MCNKYVNSAVVWCIHLLLFWPTKLKVMRIYELFSLWTNVSVKSKLQHPPPGIPRAFDVFSSPGGGNLINLIFPGAGIWSLLIGGGEFDR